MGKARIFIVEDDRIIGEDIKSSLTRYGFSISGIAFSGKEALKKIEETRPDLVLMDIMLQGPINGIEAAEHIVSGFNIPVVYLTAYIDDKILEQAKLTKPYGYIIKPFEDSELNTIIEIALYKSKMEMKIRESEAWLSTTLKSIGDAVIATDPDYQIAFMNPAAQHLTGWTMAEKVGKSLEEVFNIVNKKTGRRLKKPARKALHEIKTITGTEDDIILTQKHGDEIPINFGISTIRDERGEDIGIVLIFRDITERKKTELELRKYHERLEEMIEERTKNLQKEIAERRAAETALRDSENRLREVNEMLEDRVQKRTQDLKKINEKLVREIEERKQAEKALYESELRYRSLVENAPDIIMNLDPEGKILFINSAPIGATVDDLLDKNVFDFVPDEYHNTAREKFQNVVTNRSAEHFEIYGNMTGRWFSVRLGAIIQNNITKGATVIATDITDRKRIEELITLEKDLALELGAASGLYEGMDLCIKRTLRIYGISFALIFLNDKNTGMPEAVHHREISEDTIKKISAPEFVSFLAGAIQNGKPVYKDITEISNAIPGMGDSLKNEKWQAAAFLPIEHSGRITGCIFAASQTTDGINSFSKNALEMIAAQLGNAIGRLQAEEELRLKDIAISSSINGFIITDMEGKITYANDSLLNIWGNSLEESLGRHVTEFFENPDTAEAAITSLMGSGTWTGELKGRKKDGSVFYIYLSSNLVKDNNEIPVCMMGSVLDITERKNSEKALKQSEEKYRNLFNNAQVGLFRTRISDGKALDCNDLFAKLAGYKNREEWIETGSSAIHYTDPNFRERALKELRKNGRIDNMEAYVTRLNGDPYWVSYSARLVPDENCIEGAVIDITKRKEAEEALRISEERFRRLSEAADEGIAIHDQGVIIEANAALARMFGYELPELVGMKADRLSTPETWKIILEHIRSNSEEPYEGEGVKKDGTTFWARLSGRPFRYKGRTLRVATFNDITERKSAEELIRIQRDIMAVLGSTTDIVESFHQILRIILERKEIDCGGMYLVNSKGEVDLVSHVNFTPQFAEYVRHYSADAPQAQFVKDGRAHYQLYSTFSFAQDRILREENLKVLGIIPIHHLGKPVACINLASHTQDDIPVNFRNMLESLAAQLGEIIVRMQTREALENSENKFATAFKSSASMMAISTPEAGRFIEVNDEFINNLGYGRDEIIGKTAEELQIYSNLKQRDTLMEILGKENSVKNYEVTLKSKSGTIRNCLMSIHPIQLNDEQCALTVAHDITDRIRMETFLHIQHDLTISLSGVTEIKEALDLVLEAGTSYEDINAGGVYLVNTENGGLDLVSSKNLSPVYVNLVSRYEPDDARIKIVLEGKPFYISIEDNKDILPGETEGLKSFAILPILHQGRVIACMNIASRTYDEIPVAARHFLESIASQVGGAVSRLRFEKELKESEEKFRAITENSTDLIVIINIEGKYTYISPALDKLLGYFPDELIGKNPSLYIYPDELSLLENAAARSLENPGAPIPVRDFRAYKRNRDVIILTGTIINMLGARGVEGIVGIFHDVTERKRMEEQIQNHNRLLQEAIRKTEREMEELMEKHLRIEKLAAIGQIYGNIAHEIRNPLGAIKQSVYFLKRKLKDSAGKVQEHLDLIDRELAKTNNVISNMLTSIDIKRTNHRMFELYPVIYEAVTRCKINENIKLEFKSDEEKLEIPGDAIQLQQVLIKLITNAAQSIDKAGDILISLKKSASGDKVLIKIKDNGCGMDSDTLGKVFTPLYTTKKNGTGLGLGICKQIIEQHGGEIDLQSKPKHGTIVTITLPYIKKNIINTG